MSSLPVVFTPRTAIDELEESVLLLDAERRVVRINRAFHDLLSLPDNRDLTGADGVALIRTHLVPHIKGNVSEKLITALRTGTELSGAECWIAPSRRMACSVRVMGSGMVALLVSDITAKKEDEEKHRHLEQELARYRELFDLAPDGYFISDPSGLFLDINQAGTLLLGRERESLIGTPGESYIVPEYRAAYRNLIARLESGASEPLRGVEIQIRPAVGEPIPVSLSAMAIYDARGRLAEIRWLARDITRKMQADGEWGRLLAENQTLAAELAEERDLLRAIMEHTDVHLAYLDPDLRFVRVNTAYAEGSGHTKEELLGRGHFDLFPNLENQATFERVRDTGDAFRIYAKPFTYPDQPERGETYWDWSLVPVKDARRAVQGLVFSLSDVTERIRAEEEIHIQNRRLAILNSVIAASASAFTLEELLDSALDTILASLEFDTGMIYLLDGQDQMLAILQCHRGASEFTLMQNQTLTICHSPYNRVFVAGQPWFVEGGEETDSRDLDVRVDYGAASLAFIPLTAESSIIGALVLGSTTNPEISLEVRRTLEAVGHEVGSGILRGMLYSRLEVAHREANLYLDILTHDIRNADNITSIYADLLNERLFGKEREYLQKLQAGIRKSIETTANVATIRKICKSQARLIPVGLDEVIRDEIAHHPNAHIVYEGPRTTVLADDLLPEVFTNLIGNAVKHSGPDARVTITVEDAEEKGMVRVTIADTGRGVPDTEKEAILSRFEQGKGRGSGQGLGLSICRMLLSRYGGRIWVDDRVPGRPEEGAAFRFILRKANGGKPRGQGA